MVEHRPRRIDTVRSVIAGVSAAAFLLASTAFVRGPWHLWSLALTSFTVGAGSAALMFFPWLTSVTNPEREVLATSPASSSNKQVKPRA